MTGKLLPVLNHSGAAGANPVDRLGCAAKPDWLINSLFSVSRVRIELTTRGFSIHPTKKLRPSRNHAADAIAASATRAHFVRSLTSKTNSADLRALLGARRPGARS